MAVLGSRYHEIWCSYLWSRENVAIRCHAKLFDYSLLCFETLRMCILNLQLGLFYLMKIIPIVCHETTSLLHRCHEKLEQTSEIKLTAAAALLTTENTSWTADRALQCLLSRSISKPSLEFGLAACRTASLNQIVGRRRQWQVRIGVRTFGQVREIARNYYNMFMKRKIL